MALDPLNSSSLEQLALKGLKMFGVCDVAEAVGSKYRFVERFVLNSSVVCEICAIYNKVFSLSYFTLYHMLPISVNKRRVYFALSQNVFRQ